MALRTLGAGLVVYGITGLVLIVLGAMVGLEAAAHIERLARDADDTLAAAARTTDAAAESFTSIDGSLSEAEASADGAAQLSREASTTFDQLALAMRISVFGARPLEPLADDFATSADHAAQLGDTLDSVSGSLGSTRTDVARIGTEMAILANELRSLRESSGTAGETPPVRAFVALLLAWLAIPAVGGLIGGLALLSGQRLSRPV